MKTYPILMALLSAALFGAATPASKLLLGAFPPFQLAGLLYLGAALGVMPLLLGSRGIKSIKAPWSLEKNNRWRLLGAIGSGGILGPVFLLLGLQLASAASVSLWLNLELMATAVLGYFLFQDQLGRYGWIGVSGTVFAATLLSWGEGIAGAQAGLLVALACIAWGFDNHWTALIDGITPAESTFWKGLVAGTVNMTLGTAVQPYGGSLAVTLAGLAVGILSYGASIVLYITSAQNLGATRSQLIFASAPFFGVAFSALALGEAISPVQVAAVLILIGSLGILFQDQHKHEHSHSPIAHEHLHRHDDDHHSHVHPGQPASLLHSHWHEHPSALAHAHPHWPDLHHRHQHD